MKKLTGALALSISVLLISGCRSAGENPDRASPTDGSSPATTPATSQTGPGLQFDALRLSEKDAGPEASAKPQAADPRKAQEECLDRWLSTHKLDRYGHPEGTMYAGGTPLFDERTGESRDRLDYVFQRKPEAKKACAQP